MKPKFNHRLAAVGLAISASALSSAQKASASQDFGPIPGSVVAQSTCPNPEDTSTCQVPSSAAIQGEIDTFQAHSAARTAAIPGLVAPLQKAAADIRAQLQGHQDGALFVKLYTAAAGKLEDALAGSHPYFSMAKDFKSDAPIVQALSSLHTAAVSYEQKLALQTDPIVIDALKVARNKALAPLVAAVVNLKSTYNYDAQTFSAPSDEVLLAVAENDTNSPVVFNLNSYVQVDQGCQTNVSPEEMVFEFVGLYRDVQQKYGFESDKNLLTLVDDSKAIYEALQGTGPSGRLKFVCNEKSSFFKNIHLSYDAKSNTVFNDFYTGGNSFSGTFHVTAAGVDGLIDYIRKTLE